MSTYHEQELKNEILNFIRNQDIISTTNRGVTSVTGETHSGTGADVTFTLDNTEMKNVRAVRVGGSPVTYGSGWDLVITKSTAKVIVYSSVSGTDNYAIDYDYGTTDKLYDDFPRVETSLSSFNTGRVGFDIISAITNDIAIGGVTTNTNFLVQFTLYARDKFTIGELMYNIRKAFNDNKKSFYRFSYQIPSASDTLGKSDTPDSKVIQKTFSIKIPYLFESN